MPRWAIFVVGIYAGGAFLTLGFYRQVAFPLSLDHPSSAVESVWRAFQRRLQSNQVS
jgi:hypothetical protein